MILIYELTLKIKSNSKGCEGEGSERSKGVQGERERGRGGEERAESGERGSEERKRQGRQDVPSPLKARALASMTTILEEIELCGILPLVVVVERADERSMVAGRRRGQKMLQAVGAGRTPSACVYIMFLIYVSYLNEV